MKVLDAKFQFNTHCDEDELVVNFPDQVMVSYFPIKLFFGLARSFQELLRHQVNTHKQTNQT